MISIQKLFALILGINAIGLVVLYTISPGDSSQFKPTQELYVKGSSKKAAESSGSSPKDANALLAEAQDKLDEITKLIQIAQSDLSKIGKITNAKPKRAAAAGGKRIELQTGPANAFAAIVDADAKPAQFTREKNPFYILGAYPKPVFQIPYSDLVETQRYDKVTYGLHNDEDYCEKVDYYNLAHPENIFKRNMFFTDYGGLTVPRFLIPRIGHNIMKYFTRHGPYAKQTTREHHLDIRINTFFITMDAFQSYHRIGTHFLCATQTFNHIPGQRALIRKDDLVNSVDLHAKRFEAEPQCFNKQMFFPYSFRLYRGDECTTFFKKINSNDYIESLQEEPIQYIIKVGHGSHSANGVFLLDKNQTEWLNKEYNHGKLCGQKNQSLIAQKYITNPLLLDLNNKFDFRVYMVIASTNPLIVYYHDGFLRASLSVYDKFSGERGKHLTNTHLAEDIFNQAKKQKINGMNEKQLRDYHIWSFEELEEYLLESGKISDKNWLDNHMRPQFKKAMIHIVKMSSEFFWKESNVYALYGLDFMLDDNFNLWFIEGNPNPQLIGTSRFLGQLLDKLLRSLFEIELGLYRSRMKRALPVVKGLLKLMEQPDSVVNETAWRAEYAEAIQNRFEPEYKLSKGNSFSLVMDEYLPGAKAYNNFITPECAAVLRNQ